MLAIIEELAWSLRRDGVAIAPPQVMDMARAAALVGWEDRHRMCDAMGCVAASSIDARRRFRDAFERFFAVTEPDVAAGRDLWTRLAKRGFGEAELSFLKSAIEAGVTGADPRLYKLLFWIHGGPELAHLLGSRAIARAAERIYRPGQAGELVQHILVHGGYASAEDALALLRTTLEGALGAEAGARLWDALRAELEASRAALRPLLRARLADLHEAGGRSDAEIMAPFARLTSDEAARLRLAIRRLAERLRGAARVRRRRQQALGRIDVPRTLRRALATAGVPFRPTHRRRRRDRSRLVLLCDVSDSVRAASVLMLELVAAAHEVFERTRSFVFVRDVGEVTSLFAAESSAAAIARIRSGLVVATGDVSSYARAFRQFHDRFASALDRDTTLVILADGRTNYLPDGVEWLGRFRTRGKSIVWLCPELRAGWSIGDSAMPKYAAAVDQVLPLTSLDDFERAARRLAAGA